MAIVNQVFGNGNSSKDAVNVSPALCSKESLVAVNLDKDINLKAIEIFSNNSELVDMTPLLERMRGISIFQGGGQNVIFSEENISINDFSSGDSVSVMYSDTDGDGKIDGISVQQEVPDAKQHSAAAEPMEELHDDVDPMQELLPEAVPFIE